MSESIAQLDWTKIADELSAPFDPTEVDFRPQGKAAPNSNVQLLAYIDARTVQDRLDAVLGIENWQYDWTPVGIDSKGEIVSVKATLTIHGISKSDVGVASNFEGDKGAVSGGLKRAAVQWGIGRYLYSLPASWQKADEKGRISEQILTTLRAKLPLPKGYKKPEKPMPTKTGYATLHAVPDLPAAAPAPEPTIIPVVVTQKDWDRLKIRVKSNGMITHKLAWDKFMEDVGASYEDALAKVEAYERGNAPKEVS